MTDDTRYREDVHAHDTAPARDTVYVPPPSTETADVNTGSLAALIDNGRRDRVRWGAIWAGLVTALATFLLLTTAAIAIGALVVQGGGTDADAGMASGIISAILALVAFFVGGFVAGTSAGVLGREYGALNGFLVWALGVVLILGLAALGLGSLFGAAGDLFAQYRGLGAPAPPDVDRSQVIDAITTGAIGAFLGMILPALAAAGGGVLGSRGRVIED